MCLDCTRRSGCRGFAFRHPSWFYDAVLDLLQSHHVALAIGDHPNRRYQMWECTTDIA